MTKTAGSHAGGRGVTMFLNWLPWRFIIRRMARSHDFLDPIDLMGRLAALAQPSEVAVPVELLREGAVLHARGLINSRILQHNPDWVWPYWVVRQFDPRSTSFIPRAYSITHINLTHRNWTAVGLPGRTQMPLIDPRGLVTPVFNGWSIDAWIVTDDGDALIPSHLPEIEQGMAGTAGVEVVTGAEKDGMRLRQVAAMEERPEPVCVVRLSAAAGKPAVLAVAVRPYNPEGVSFINSVGRREDGHGFIVNGENTVALDKEPDRYAFSEYADGDVRHRLFEKGAGAASAAVCGVGLASAAAVYTLVPGREHTVEVSVPLPPEGPETEDERGGPPVSWEAAVAPHAGMEIDDKRISRLFDIHKKVLVQHTPRTVFAGPFSYKRFWFRDAAFILNALLAINDTRRVRDIIETFFARQTRAGYFKSQNGEWDSNGQALWIMERYIAASGEPLPPRWNEHILRGARWILDKRVREKGLPQTGLMPAGFSAEHLGPNDFYYWDDFWSVAGLEAAARLQRLQGDAGQAGICEQGAAELAAAVERSLERAAERVGRPAIPASPGRRLDGGAIGSLAAGYPLRIRPPGDRRIRDTAAFLHDNYMIKNGFYHEVVHSGINAYLTMHLAQVMLRDGDPRYLDLINGIADYASPTGQWPEAIHPRTGYGCMGDGQHAWAAAEWVSMIRNCFVREEDDELILLSGVPPAWYEASGTFSFGPTATAWGPVSLRAARKDGYVEVALEFNFHGAPPRVRIALPGYRPAVPGPGERKARCVKL